MQDAPLSPQLEALPLSSPRPAAPGSRGQMDLGQVNCTNSYSSLPLLNSQLIHLTITVNVASFLHFSQATPKQMDINLESLGS